MDRVYVHEGDTWTLAASYAKRHELPTDAAEYIVFETVHPPSLEPVCQLIGSRRLCDVGPGHDHGDSDGD